MVVVPDLFRDAYLQQFPRDQPSSPCDRCSNYGILEVCGVDRLWDHVQDSERVDSMLTIPNGAERTRLWQELLKDREEHNLVLGNGKDIQLFTNCPLCRLIFHIFPSEGLWRTEDAPTYRLRVFPAYERQATLLLDRSGDLTSRYAAYFTVEDVESGKFIDALAGRTAALSNNIHDSFALSRKHTVGHRDCLSSRKVPAKIDYTLLRKWLKRCEQEHGTGCSVAWFGEAAAIRVIDVQILEVVDCPAQAEYVALSYVWGGVSPVPDALRSNPNGLPQTIKDAIRVVKELGKRYLWVNIN